MGTRHQLRPGSPLHAARARNPEEPAQMPGTDILDAIERVRKELTDRMDKLREEWQADRGRLVSREVYESDRRADDSRFKTLEGRPERMRANVLMWVAIIGTATTLSSCVLSLAGSALFYVLTHH